MKYFKKLIGVKIYLSPINAEDAPIYTKWLNDFNVTDGLGTSSRLDSLEKEKTWLENSLNKADFQFAIVDLETDTLIGNCGFFDISFSKRCATVAIFIGEEENRNKGYGKDALMLLLDFGFNYLNINNIMLTVYPFNNRGIQAYKKVGFKEFGRRRKAYFVNGKYFDIVHMDMLAEEFSGNYIQNKSIDVQ